MTDAAPDLSTPPSSAPAPVVPPLTPGWRSSEAWISLLTIVSLVLVVVTISTSCGSSTNCQDPKSAQSTQCVVEGAVVDCTGVASLTSAVTIVEPIVEQLILSAVQPDGSILWASIESQVVALALQYGGCVIAEIWDYYIHGTPIPGIGSGSGAATPASFLARVKIVPADFTAEFNRIRVKIAPGRSFKTTLGTTL